MRIIPTFKRSLVALAALAGLTLHQARAAESPPVFIYNAWWTQVADQDQDGCVAPETSAGLLRLNWDADVADGGTVEVYEKVYSRPTGATKWTLLGTTTPRPISGNNTLDAQHLDLVPAGSCIATDYKIELYRTGIALAEDIRDPANDDDLRAHSEETYVQDTGPIIADAWWSNASDRNSDGCWAPTLNGTPLRLNWDPNVAGGGTLMVFERVYRSPAGSNDWTLIFTTSRHAIDGTSPNDVQWVDVEPAGACTPMDYKIELVQAGSPDTDYVRSPTNDPDLNAHREQLFAEDNTAATLGEVWWSETRDRDRDGCFAPAASSGLMRLNWDANVSGSGSLSVYAKVFWRPSGGGAWTLAATSPTYVITGNSTVDAQFAPMYPGASCSTYDYRIELYRTGSTTPDAVKDATTDAVLAQHKEETAAQDAAAMIADAWWSQIADNDGDGCVAPNVQNARLRLNWNSDAAGGSTMNVFERVYRRNPSSPDWTLVYTSSNHTVVAENANDIQFIELPGGEGCTPAEYKIEIYQAGTSIPDDIRSGANDPDLAVRNEETWAEDNTFAVSSLTWANTIDADQDGCVAPASSDGSLQLRYNIDAISAGTFEVSESIYRRSGGSQWALIATTPVHLVTGASSADTQQVAITPLAGCANAEYKIEVLRQGSGIPLLILDATAYPALAPRKEETFAQDNPSSTISRAWWTQIVDADGDGCFAPVSNGGLGRLNWAPFASGGESLRVFSRIYRRQAGSDWQLIGSTAPLDLPVGDSNVVHSVDIPLGSDCTAFEYRIELYRDGRSEPDIVRDGSTEPALASRPEESFSQDNEPVRFVEAWWSNLLDQDGDGCFAPTSNSGLVRLNWDADVFGSGEVIVFARVYMREPGQPDWVLAATNSAHTIEGFGGEDSNYLEFRPPSGCAFRQFRLELYRPGGIDPETVYFPEDDPDLAGTRFEAFAEDNNVPTIFNVWWSRTADEDQDGCLAADNPANLIRLHWDPDGTGSTALQVFEEVYVRTASDTNWTLLTKTSPHQITGTSGTDTQFVEVQAGSGCDLRDYQIRIFRVGSTEPDYIRDPSNDALLNDRREETWAEDHEVTLISRTWWTDTADLDGDGCFAPATAAGLITLNWDPDVAGTGSRQVFARVYTRQAGTTTWTLLSTTAEQTIVGATTNDSQRVSVPPLGNCQVSEYRIELFRVGIDQPDSVRDPSTDPGLSHKEETFAQDPGVAPAITAQPQSLTVSPGSNAVFTVTATGSAPLTYHWYFQQTNLIVGASGASLNVENASHANVGTYSVTVSNAFGTASSSAATLSLREATPPTLGAPRLTSAGAFQFDILGTPGSIYQVQATANLADWAQTGENLTNVSGTVSFTDTNNAVTRFYRAIRVP